MGSLFILADALADAGNASSTAAAISLPLVVIVGFLAATGIGSIAWYNSKRPPGWEEKERPDVVPEVELDDTPGLGTPEV
jgi:hypothetical protein